MHLSVIIVNYNVKHFLEQCLYSVKKACKGIDAEIIVTDNNSTDGSRALLEPAFPEVHFIWNDSNVGFARANNQALEQAKGDFILFLNPDTILPEDCIEKSLQFFKTHVDAGALGIRMIDGSGKFLKESKRAFPSPLTSLFKLTGLTYLFPHSRIFGRYHLGHLSQLENQEVDVLAGAFMMVPKKLLDKIGNFDDDFFMYGEDVDLSYRIQQAPCTETGGTYRNYYFSESTIIHFKGESTKRGSLNYVRLFYKAMSQFVKKHYTGSRAGVFIFFIQLAILIRAGLSALGNLLKKAGLPVLDALIILTSLWVTRFLWSTYIRQETDYSPNVLFIGFPAFTAIFLIAAYYSGLYDKGFKQTQLFRATGIAGLVLLSFYALLPDNIRFSRGIIVFGILLAFVLMNLMRLLFIKLRYLETGDEHEERKQTIVVSGSRDFEAISQLLQHAGLQKRVLGRVSSDRSEEGDTLGYIGQLPGLIRKYPVKEIIFCENGLTYKEIIELLGKLPKGARNKFHASGSSSIVGSDNSKESGTYISEGREYAIGKPKNRRNKRTLDIGVSLFFLLSFPVQVFINKRPLRFYRNVFSVLFKQKTWVGYAGNGAGLPSLINSVLTSTALPAALNELPAESLQKSDEWYATGFSVLIDMKKIRRGYQYLGY